MTARDYRADMATAIRDRMPEGDLVPSVEADRLHRWLLASDPDLLNGWLVANAVVFLTDMIGAQERARRSHARGQRERAAFAKDAKSVENGHADSGSFAVRYQIDAAHTWRPVAQMTGVDHTFVAAGYEASAKTDLALAAFHRAVAKRLRNRTTADVFTETQYDEMYRSIASPAVKTAAVA